MSDVNINFPPAAAPTRAVTAGEVEDMVIQAKADVEGQVSAVVGQVDAVTTQLEDTTKNIDVLSESEVNIKKYKDTAVDADWTIPVRNSVSSLPVTVLSRTYTNPLSGGGTINLPPGVYEIEGVELPHYTRIIGSGQNATILKLKNNATKPMFTNADKRTTYSPQDGNGTHGLVFENLKILGNKENQVNSFPLLDFKTIWNVVTFKNVIIAGSKNIGINIETADNVHFENCEVMHCDGQGIVLDGVFNSTISKTLTNFNKGGGVLIKYEKTYRTGAASYENMGLMKFDEAYFEGNETFNIKIDKHKNVKVKDSLFYPGSKIGVPHILVTNGARNSHISGNVFSREANDFTSNVILDETTEECLVFHNTHEGQSTSSSVRYIPVVNKGRNYVWEDGKIDVKSVGGKHTVYNNSVQISMEDITNYIKNSNDLSLWTSKSAGTTASLVPDIDLWGNNVNVSQVSIEAGSLGFIGSTSNTGSTIQIGEIYSFIAWVKADAPTSVRFYGGNGAANDYTRKVYEIGTEWKPIAISHRFTTANQNFVGRIYNIASSTNPVNFKVADTMIIKGWHSTLPIPTGANSVTQQKAHRSKVDIELMDGRGVILRSPNGTKFRMTVNDAGQPVFTQL